MGVKTPAVTCLLDHVCDKWELMHVSHFRPAAPVVPTVSRLSCGETNVKHRFRHFISPLSLAETFASVQLIISFRMPSQRSWRNDSHSGVWAWGWMWVRGTLNAEDLTPTLHPTHSLPFNNYAFNSQRSADCNVHTLRASLSGTFRQTLPDLVTPLKGHSSSPRSAPSERLGY